MMTREIELMLKIDNFCECCDRCDDCGDWDFARGAPAYQSEQTCPADFDPGRELDCPYHDEYQALLDEQAEMEAAEDEREDLDQ